VVLSSTSRIRVSADSLSLSLFFGSHHAEHFLARIAYFSFMRGVLVGITYGEHAFILHVWHTHASCTRFPFSSLKKRSWFLLLLSFFGVYSGPAIGYLSSLSVASDILLSFLLRDACLSWSL